MTRLDQLVALRDRINAEIARERDYQRRLRPIATQLRVVFADRDEFTQLVLTAAAEHYGLEVADLTGKARGRDESAARQVAAWALREAGRSFPEIGRILNRDHSTACYAVQKVTANDDLLGAAKAVWDHATTRGAA